MSDSEDTTGTDDSAPNKTIWGKIKDLKTHAGEAAFNEKVYLLLRAVLKEEKYFDKTVDSDMEIKKECNNLYTTWEKYLDNNPDSDNVNIQLPQLKEAYLKCEPLVEKKLKNYVGKKGIEAAQKLKATVGKTKEQILQQSQAFAKTASDQYKNMSENLTSIARNIAEQTKNLTGANKEKAIKQLTENETANKGLSDQEKQHMEDMMKSLVFNINIDNKSSSTKGGARLTRKRNINKKKRRTRRNRKLN